MPFGTLRIAKTLHVIARKTNSGTEFKPNRNLIVDGQNPYGINTKNDKLRRIENQNGFEKLT